MATRRARVEQPIPRQPLSPERRAGLFVEVPLLLTDEEVDLLDAMMRAGAHSTLASLVRTALWNYARHHDLDVPVEAFAQGGREKHGR